MNREIKFRGKPFDTLEWEYGDLIHGGKDRDIILIEGIDGITSMCRADTVGQYTGLKDKNGVDIYEGDIIMSKDSVGDAIYHEVFYEEKEGRFMGALNFNMEPSFGVSGLSQGWIDEFEKVLVGNIYDNPELKERIKR